ncbi:uncharacterized protein LOC110030348 isoform X2 [Phalaenopsis equestris]|uniref:uncharacterized protein LOC110030348 isoform X2 n=1 Tax=Phalaenopsis equestris TaxID=78828 RepID=UPI0009E2872F|nr:uncharacterized protein LOC110030348 isoform X2 [Phalaenopsis equestris]
MWVEILCGIVVYKIFRRFLLGEVEVPDFDAGSSNLYFAVASRLEKIYGGKAYVGLRIPDPETSSRQHIDVVLVTKREVMVVAVRNFSGFVLVGDGGDWVCTKDKKHKPETFPDPVLETARQVEVLQSYLELRGVSLPKGCLSAKVILPNPECRPAYSIAFQPEVVSFDKWVGLKSDVKPGIFSWIKDVFPGSKCEAQDDCFQKLHFILNTAPKWDRLEFIGDKSLLGEFIEFIGKPEDLQALRHVNRSEVGQFIVQKPSLFGLGRSRLNIIYSPRDFRGDAASPLEWNDIAVKPYTEILFQPLNSKKPRKFKLSNIASVSLSA